MIEIRKISFSYRPGRGVLFDGLSLDLTDGMVHGLLGLNGTGKTTLLKTICGLLVPQAGSVAVDGRRTALRQPSWLCDIAMVPEEVALPAVTMQAFVRRTAPFYPFFSEQEFAENCQLLGVDASMNTAGMSMGSRKKAYMAFVMACGTPYLLLDEPANGLDIPSKNNLRQLIASAADQGRTVVIATHQVSELQNLIDSVTILDRRGIVLSASTADIAGRLRFGPPCGGDEALYCGESLAGRVCVSENTDCSDTEANLELLFHAATQHRDRMAAIMNR